MSDASRPNVLYIFTDQQWAGAMSCAGNRDLRTPNMDRLAAEGVRFPNAYCSFPMCVPARASMITGRPPHALGMNGALAPDCNVDITEADLASSLGRLMSDAGYRCGWGGKWHTGLRGGGCWLPPREKLDHGFDYVAGFDDNALPDACERFLQGGDDRPFFLVASFDNPHNIGEFSRDFPLPWLDRPTAPPEQYPNLPANFPPAPFEPEAITALRQNPAPVARNTVARDLAFDLTRWREERFGYDRLVEYVDAQVGEVLDALDAAGHREDTIVIFSSDHGEMAGAHRLARKWVLYEESACVPLIVRDPFGGRRGAVDDALVSNGLDLLPTLCGYAGIEPPTHAIGHDFGRRVRDAEAPSRENLVVETNLPDGGNTVGRMVRTRDYAYHLYKTGLHGEQLFDMHADRGQMVNLAMEPRYGEVLDDHRRRLADWCRKTNDRGLAHYAKPGHVAIPGLGWVSLTQSLLP